MEGGRGREEGVGGEAPGLCSLPQTATGGGETSPPDLGAHLWVHTEGPPPFAGVEGILIETSDRFGRGRGE